MPLKRTQSILIKLLPNWCFTPLYELARRGYRAWCKISDELYYPLSYIYHALKRDSRKVKRIKIIYSIRQYTLVGRTGLLTTYDIASEIERKNLAVVERVKHVARRLNRTPAQIALRWVLENPGVTTALVGLKNTAQLEENVIATDITLSQADIEFLSNDTRTKVKEDHRAI